MLTRGSHIPRFTLLRSRARGGAGHGIGRISDTGTGYARPKRIWGWFAQPIRQRSGAGTWMRSRAIRPRLAARGLRRRRTGNCGASALPSRRYAHERYVLVVRSSSVGPGRDSMRGAKVAKATASKMSLPIRNRTNPPACQSGNTSRRAAKRRGSIVARIDREKARGPARPSQQGKRCRAPRVPAVKAG